jgi:hypothetical protein
LLVNAAVVVASGHHQLKHSSILTITDMSQSAQLHNHTQYFTLSEDETIIGGWTREHEDLVAANNVIQDTLFDKISTFSYNKRLRLSLGIRELYKGDFVLIRGLIEFHRTRDLKFTFDKNNRSIEADIDRVQLADLQSFLIAITTWLKKEKQFRIALKIVREFENRYKLEAASVYEVMRNTSVSPA